ncbi:MAG: S-adenosylmethionine:tRNA ribosyltransferase-isomerase, partial [Phycisphaeraceae bacterium]|nr:S-adenosylmethionine:tRNA ribosyltransferase-isomerase [Phycisphaeraceae bacterium]
MGLRTDQLDFELDPALVAAAPVSPRDSARMLVVTLPPADVEDDGSLDLEHRRIADLPEYLGAGDRLVLNETRVVPARIRGRRVDTGGGLEGLLAESAGLGRWWAMLRKSRRLRPGHEIDVLDHDGASTGFRL